MGSNLQLGSLPFVYLASPPPSIARDVLHDCLRHASATLRRYYRFLHDVPVEWTEYLPVERTSPLRVLDAEGRSLPRHEAEANAPGPWRDALLRWNPAGAGVWFHRATVSRRG